MFKEHILNNRERKEYILLKTLYIESKPILKRDLCNILNISSPTLSSLIESIKSQIFQGFCEQNLIFKISKLYIELVVPPNLSIDKILKKIINQSNNYRFLMYLYCHNGAFNHLKVCQNLDISESSLYRTVLDCNKLLSKYDLRIQNKHLTGSTSQKVYFYYSLISICDDYEKVLTSELSESIIRIVNSYETLNFAQNKKLMLWCSLCVNFCRENGGSPKKVEEFIINWKGVAFENILMLVNNSAVIKKENILKFVSLVCMGICGLEIYSTDAISMILRPINSQLLSVLNNFFLILSLTFQINNTDKHIIKMKSSLYSLLFRMVYFKGRNGSVDQVTLTAYKKRFETNYRINLADLIIKKIIKYEKVFTSEDILYLRESVIFILAGLLPKDTYLIKIGLALKTSSLVLNATVPSFKRHLEHAYHVKIFDYKLDEKYDLVISNFDSKYLNSNYDYLYVLSNLDIDYDINNIFILLEDLAKKKYKKFFHEFEASLSIM